MTGQSKKPIVPDAVQEKVNQDMEDFTARRDWAQFVSAFRSLSGAALAGPSPFDPRFNAFHWASDVHNLCVQIAHGYCWMTAYGAVYRQQVPSGSSPAHAHFKSSYFADNCITRIDSCRDKLALCVWAYYCPFNPEKKVLDYPQVIERLRYPVEFGLRLKNQACFLQALEILTGSHFDRVEKYRHLKIHRREPRIEMHGVAGHHDLGYILPLIRKADIRRYEKELEAQYPDPTHRELRRTASYVDGVLFDRRRLADRVWDFSEVQRQIASCLAKLLEASAVCFRILRMRAPFRGRTAET